MTDPNLAAFVTLRGRSHFLGVLKDPYEDDREPRLARVVFKIQTPICRARVGRGTVRSCVNDGLHLVEAALSRGQIFDAGTVT
jgi:hypothetical protein